jgi:CheY-like chemotaxis protein
MVSVLVVDDYAPSLYAHSRALREVGYRVLEATNGRAALDIAAGERPDILLLDVHLPDMHGFEVCQQLKSDARTADIQVIHLSATGRGDRYRRESAAVGAFAYLQEPMPPAQLLRVLRLAVEASRNLRADASVSPSPATPARKTLRSVMAPARRATRRSRTSNGRSPGKPSG